MSELIYSDIGRRSYDSALRIQRRLLDEAIAGGDGPAQLLLLEHDPPVITLGRSAGGGHILASRDRLEREGIEVRQSARGGDVTYHGPGQLVGYPIIQLARKGRTVRGYVHSLEEVIIRLLGRFSLTGRRREGFTGVWVGDEKIAAIGIAVKRWVAWHGFALNVSTDLRHFDFIVPCGLAGCKVTSMEKLLAQPVQISRVRQPLIDCMSEVFGFDSVRESVTVPEDPPVPSCDASQPASRSRFPSWLRRRIPPAGQSGKVRQLLKDSGLETVCTGANCPNRSECFGRGTATFMILGAACTRSCRFCAVPTGGCLPLRADEPEAVADAASRLGLKHVVITSVTRDDLADGGAEHFAKTIRAVRLRLPKASVEVLTPDFHGDKAAIDLVLAAGPDVFSHNIETVPRLYRQVRPQARYRRSLDVLAYAARRASEAGIRLLTKSGIMVGLGETRDEVRGAMHSLRDVGCDILTIGQYLAPSPEHAQIARFVEPAEFDAMRADGLEMGFAAVAAGPFVRSSYHAEEIFQNTQPAGF